MVVPALSTQSKRLALLRGADGWWKQPLVYAFSTAKRFDVTRLQQTLLLLSRRHSGLRTIFREDLDLDHVALLDTPAWPLTELDVSGSSTGVGIVEEQSLIEACRPFLPYDNVFVRALLMHRPETDLLVLTIDHSILDARSARILFDDFSRVYEGLLECSFEEFDALISDVVSLAVREHAWLTGAEGRTALHWWDEVNSGYGAYPEISIPTENLGRPGVVDVVVPLTRSDMESISRRCRRLRVSKFMLAATAAAAVLGAHGNGDIGFLFANSRRNWDWTRDVVGYVANRSLLRVNTGQGRSLPDIANSLRLATIAAVSHGIMSHEEYVRRRFPEAFHLEPAIPYFHLNVLEEEPLKLLPDSEAEVVANPGVKIVPPGMGVNVTLSKGGAGSLLAFHRVGAYGDGMAQSIAERMRNTMVEGDIL